MIYKFTQQEACINMEVEHFKDNLKEIPDSICFSIGESDDDMKQIHLSKEDVYKLIGALHLLHKEMK